jgi:hypothetical protein
LAWKAPARQPAVDQVGVDLLDDRVVAMLFLGLDELIRAVGEDRVVGNSSSCPTAACWSSRLTRRTINRAVTARPFFELNAV